MRHHASLKSGLVKDTHSTIVNIVARYVDYPLKINHEARRSFDIPISVLKIDRARNEPGWAPIVPFDEGVARAILDVKSRL